MDKLFHKCKRCEATGTEDFMIPDPPGPAVPGSVTCRKCLGEGRHSNTWLHEDLITLLHDMKGKIDDIFEKVNE